MIFRLRFKIRFLVLMVLVCASVGIAPQAWGSSQLITRSAIFSEPTVTVVRLSPAGNSVAYIATPETGPEVRVRVLSESAGDDRLVDQDMEGRVQNLWWMPDGSGLLHQRAVDDGTHLFLQRLDGSEATNLTPITGASATLARTSLTTPDQIAVEIHEAEARAGNLWRIDLETGARTLLADMKGFSRIHLDNQLQPRVAERQRLDGGIDLLQRGDSDTWVRFLRLEPDHARVTGVIGLHGDGETLYLVDNTDRERSVLLAVDLSTGEEQLLAEDPNADLRPVAMRDPGTGEVLSVSANFGALNRYHLRDDVRTGFSFLEHTFGGDVGVSDVSEDMRTWLVLPMDGGPMRFSAYQRDHDRVVPLFPMYASLADEVFGERLGRVVESRDEFRFPVHVYLPPSTGGDLPKQPLPTVIYVHGGPHVAYPWDSWFTNRVLQLLANRGYAVIRAEFRGAGGMGKKVWEAGAFEWGGGAYRDVLDITAWAIREGIADEDRIGIFGWSYGGYMAMHALTQSDTPFACGVSMYGPSDLGALIARNKPFFRRRIADERTPEGINIIQEQSPIHHVDELSTPLLMTNGGEDPVVVYETQAVPFVEQASTRGAQLTSVYYPDETHDYRRAENWISFWAVAEHFLAEHLGGQAEPYGDDLSGTTSMEVVAGAEFVPGLEEALGGGARS